MNRAPNQFDGRHAGVLAWPRILEMDRNEEGALVELVRAFRAALEAVARSAEDSVHYGDEFVREDEFTCHGCNLILHRSLLGGEERTLCGRCSARFRTAIAR